MSPTNEPEDGAVSVKMPHESLRGFADGRELALQPCSITAIVWQSE